MRNRSGRLAAMVLGGLLVATAAMAQNSSPTPPPTSYDDYFRTLTRDARGLSSREQSHYIDRIRMWLAHEYGAVVPDPAKVTHQEGITR